MLDNSQRIDFSKSIRTLPYPDFLSIQLDSFQRFFKIGSSARERKKEHLYQVFMDNFPVTDSRENYVLEFLDYTVEHPRYSIKECLDQGLTYSVPIKVRFRVYTTDEEIEFEPSEKEVYLGNIPYMTPGGSFIINGAERVIVSQLHRSPGVFFSQTKHTNGTNLYSARIIPFRGSWIEFTTDTKNVIYAYIDRKKKFPLTTLLRAIGYGTDKQILDLFGICEEVPATKNNLSKIIGRKIASRILKTWVEDFGDEETGEIQSIERYEVIFERNHILGEKDIEKIIETDIETIVLYREDVNLNDYNVVYNTLNQDNSNSEKEAVEQIYRQLRNVDPPDEQTARDTIQGIFFSEKRYDLGEVGRYKINKKLGLNIQMDIRVLSNLDIVSIVKHLIVLVNSRAVVDDIDHLSNRRVRTVGEQIQAQFALGLARMARNVRERMNVRDNEKFTPVDLVNGRTLSSVINSFFGTNQLSQFMDQTNPLAEITHKRRVSALGPGGLSRERAGFEVRDVHYTHYGRLCTIETPEGPNIGLISSLCVHAQINNMGFIETPYKKIQKGKVTNNIHYLSAEEEDGKNIGQATAKFNKDGNFEVDLVKTRYEGDYSLLSPEKLTYIDVAPNQIVSVAASIIPFLEHDDANRALMGSNMQRQAVPLMKPEAPIVGTGLEKFIVRDSRSMLMAENNGIIEYVDADEIVIKYELLEEQQATTCESNLVTYKLAKFRRTNQDTCFDQKPLVRKGDKVIKGQILTEGYATSKGELALGVNLKVAFMPWQGYNFEDAIVISERVVKEDIFTSIHIKDFSLNLRDSKRNQEEFTSEIPNVSEDAVKNLDENGIIRVGSLVKEDDILIGKITPKGETDPTPEEKLLRAIFGDKAGDVKDASLRAYPSLEGVVVNTQVFTRIKKTKKSDKTLINQSEIDAVKEEYRSNLIKLKEIVVEKLYRLLKNKTALTIKNQFEHIIVEKGTKFTKDIIYKTFFPEDNPYEESNYNIKEEVTLFKYVNFEGWTKDEQINVLVKSLLNNYLHNYNKLSVNFKRKLFSLEVGDELPQGIVQLAKVYIAQKRKLKVGDKMAGRHGNKGVVAKIVREEDMPFLEDGTPVDVVLNPLGVPSRMNIGQIYETILGWAGLKLDKKYATPIFDGASEQEVIDELNKSNLPNFGRTVVYDGLTGEKFDQPVTVGVIYILKLGHMVDDKMHARSIGPYSLITQQPLGGKAQFGGQRFGEMEVWALEAFGAAHILQEMLTVKSDDVIGRAKVYESIVKNEPVPSPSVPESFNVLIHELRGLCLDITLD